MISPGMTAELVRSSVGASIHGPTIALHSP